MFATELFFYSRKQAKSFRVRLKRAAPTAKRLSLLFKKFSAKASNRCLKMREFEALVTEIVPGLLEGVRRHYIYSNIDFTHQLVSEYGLGKHLWTVTQWPVTSYCFAL